MTGKMEQLKRLTGMVYRLRQSELQALRAEETRLRAALTEIEENRRATAAADRADPVRQSLGADILWQGWLDAQQRDLNMELARLRARQEPVEHRLRKAFGRDQVAQALAVSEWEAQRARARKRQD